MQQTVDFDFRKSSNFMTHCTVQSQEIALLHTHTKPTSTETGVVACACIGESIVGVRRLLNRVRAALAPLETSPVVHHGLHIFFCGVSSIVDEVDFFFWRHAVPTTSRRLEYKFKPEALVDERFRLFEDHHVREICIWGSVCVSCCVTSKLCLQVKTCISLTLLAVVRQIWMRTDVLNLVNRTTQSFLKRIIVPVGGQGGVTLSYHRSTPGGFRYVPRFSFIRKNRVFQTNYKNVEDGCPCENMERSSCWHRDQQVVSLSLCFLRGE